MPGGGGGEGDEAEATRPGPATTRTPPRHPPRPVASRTSDMRDMGPMSAPVKGARPGILCRLERIGFPSSGKSSSSSGVRVPYSRDS